MFCPKCGTQIPDGSGSCGAAAPRHDLIKVNNVLQHNHIYAYPHQYELVWNHLASHCPGAKARRGRV